MAKTEPPKDVDEYIARFSTEVQAILERVWTTIRAVAPEAKETISFMATFESTDRTTEFLAFRIGYAVLGVGCVIGVGALLVKAMRKPHERSSR